MTGYWDIHNHILPGVDDGSGCMRETMEMLEEEYRQCASNDVCGSSSSSCSSWNVRNIQKKTCIIKLTE